MVAATEGRVRSSDSRTHVLHSDLEEKGEDGATGRQMLERTERRWKLADADGDGALDKSEFKSFLHPEEDDRVRHVVVLEATEMMDSDKSGEVSFEEYMQHLRKVSGPEKDKDKDWSQVGRPCPTSAR